MFYSHEILTSRKHGVATIWLVATLGAKSSLKKVSRKAILDVDVVRACETIENPEAPMALRLQGGLLYGVTRVYSQQCGYVLNDAENARNSMKAALNAMRLSKNEVEGGHKGRADQLVLPDDPNFLPGFDFAAPDLNSLGPGMEYSQRSTLSPHGSQAASSQQTIGGIDIPQSGSSWYGDAVRGLSRLGDSEASRLTGAVLLDDDLGITVDVDGEVQIGSNAEQLRAPTERPDTTNGYDSILGSEWRASVRARPAVAGTTAGQPDDDGFMPTFDDGEYFVPGAVASRVTSILDSCPAPQQQITSEETAEAPLRRRKKVARKVMPLDVTTELRNGDLAGWNKDYLANMAEALRIKNAHKAVVQAKRNAEFWVLGSLDQADRGPLSMFQGAELLKSLAGVDLRAPGVPDAKRSAEEELTSDRRKRRRDERHSQEVGRGGNEVPLYDNDEGYQPLIDDDTVEQGRHQPTPLDDERHLSSTFPWNQSTGSRRPFGSQQDSWQGRQRLSSFSAGGAPFGPTMSGRGSRLITQSPLIGRGALPGVEDGLDDFQLPTGVDMIDEEAFQLYGPAAAVDTQTAGQSQWQRAVMDSESANFLAFVKEAIELKTAKELDAEGGADPMDEGSDQNLGNSIEFESLLPPAENSKIVAAQAFLHVLTLGTKHLLEVAQEDAFEQIHLRMVL